ncbi:PAS domain S-box protein [Caenimonas terrae]|uniref:histidine kinase n=1 Tax=Caenimonas terrae TaxID=696074 RepID=A0ABW0NF97_9BURK
MNPLQRLAKPASWAWDLGTDELWLSPGCSAVLGVSISECKGTFEGFIELVHPDDRQNLREAAMLAQSSRGTVSLRYRLRPPDHAEKLIVGEAEAHLNDDEVVSVLVGTVTDASSEEEGWQTLQRSAERLKSVVGTATEWYWEQDADYRFTLFAGGRNGEINPKRGQVLGTRRWDTPGSLPRTGTWEQHVALLDARQPYHEFEYRTGPQDTPRFVSSNGQPFFNAEGKFKGYRGSARDVTARVLLEMQAQSAKTQLEMATRLGRLGAWSVSLPDLTITWSDEALHLYDVADDPPRTAETALDLIHPDSRAWVHDAMRACSEQGLAFDLAVRAFAGRHRLIWVRIIGEADRDEAGQIRRIQGAVQDISERMDAAEGMRILNERLTTTLESITESFFTLDRDWRLTYVNREAERLLARPRAELLGTVLWDQFPSEVGNLFHQQYEKALAEGVTVRFEGYSVALDMWLKVVAYPSAQGLAVYFRDITQARRARQDLAASEERYRMLFETSRDAILQTDGEGNILRANPAACRAFAMTAAEICARRREELVDPADLRLAALLRVREAIGHAEGMLTLVRKDGSRFEGELATAKYVGKDQCVVSNTVIRDMTKELAYKQQILRMNSQLGDRVRQRTAQLEEANSELKSFSHALAHDLRAPIAAISGFGRVVEESLMKAGSERDLQYVRKIRSAAQRMDEYVEALLSLATISQTSLRVADVDMSAHALAIVGELRDRWPEREVETEVQPSLAVRGDARLLRMALENLLGNAWKFTARSERVRISFTAQTRSDGELVFCVRDNGAGFDMAYADKLFGNFQRLHNLSEFPGTGIGLANVSRIVRRHGGSIWAESREGEGAAFFFTLGGAAGEATEAPAGLHHEGLGDLV